LKDGDMVHVGGAKVFGYARTWNWNDYEATPTLQWVESVYT
jgi:hypothetical protein